MEHFIEGPYIQRSGQSDATSDRYNLHVGKSGRIWLTPISGEARMIIAEGGPGSQGFGGADLTFTLKNGVDKITLHSPWSSNTDALFEDTGIDLRNKHLTWGCIGRHRKFIKANGISSPTVFLDLVYWDRQPTLGSFDRIKELAREMSFEMGEVLFCYSQSIGGSSAGPALSRPTANDWDKLSDEQVTKLHAMWDKYQAEQLDPPEHYVTLAELEAAGSTLIQPKGLDVHNKVIA